VPTKTKQWDVFISHASEDKRVLVAPLAKILEKFGVEVWYDEFTLRAGDSLRESIDKGLSRSTYGILVLSPAFVAKPWTTYELNGLIAGVIEGVQKIIPIWHEISKHEVYTFSPPLADRIALSSSAHSIEEIAIKIIEVIRPDLLTRIHQRIEYKLRVRSATTEFIDPRKILRAPIQHEALSQDLVSRIRLIRASLMTVYPNSMKFWLDGFQRDSHPSKEILYWERVASVYLETFSCLPYLNSEHRETVFHLIHAMMSQYPDSSKNRLLNSLPKDVSEIIAALVANDLPAIDIEEQKDVSDSRPVSESEVYNLIDKEHMEHNPPDDLVDRLLGNY